MVLIIFLAQYVPDQLDNFINAINSKLQPLFMQIRKGMSEESGQQHYALVCLFNSSLCPLCLSVYNFFHLQPEMLTANFSTAVQVNMAETEVTRMSSDYTENELELFRKTVSH